MLYPKSPIQLELTEGHKKILAACQLHGAISRAQLTKVTGLRSGTVTSLSKDLLMMNLIKEGERIKIGRGQPTIPIELNPYAAFSFGVSFHIGTINIGVVDFTNNLIDTIEFSFNEQLCAEDVVKLIQSHISSLTTKHRLQHSRILGLGISLPGPSHGNGRTIQTIASLSHWRDVDLSRLFSEYFSFPVWIDNDCNAAVMGEFHSKHWHSCQSMILIELSHGVGGGAIINGKLLRGRTDNAGEIGTYFNVIGENKKPTIRNLIKRLKANSILVEYPDDIPLEHPIVQDWITEAAEALRPFITLTMGWFDPDCIVIAAEGDRLLIHSLIEKMQLEKDWSGYGRHYEMPVVSPTLVGKTLNTYGACMYPSFFTLNL
ncbi:ROK family transcriptional regulator [Vibrio sp.]|nr:ROK family transcriptional regulator [Vibrio sp.]